MVEKVYFEKYAYLGIEYEFDGDEFRVSCVAGKNEYLNNCELYVCSSDNSSAKIGSFSVKDDFFGIKKEYPLSYLKSYGINKDNISSFFLKSDNVIIDYANIIKDDFPMKRAREYLDFRHSPPSLELKNKAIKLIENSVVNYETVNFPVLEDFIWYEINSINDFCDVSSVKHIISSFEFYKCFEKTKKWYFGVKHSGENCALGIFCEARFENPLINVSDCASVFEISNNYFWVSGIAFLDDGQYFYKIM